MEQRFRTPEELVEGLHGRQPAARAQLWQLLREPLKHLMRDLIARHGLDEDQDLLATHALHSTETGLRARQLGAFANLSWTAFRATLLLQMARLAIQPHGIGTIHGSAGPLPLPDSPAYQSQTFFRPFTRLGNNFFGGDWYAGRQLDDGSLWVFLADVTGHGYFAYLLASGLPSVWQRCWSVFGECAPDPSELLAYMHELLCDCMPEGIYLECTLARLGSDGHATIVPAGGTRIILRSGACQPSLLKFRGAWLGLRAPTIQEQHTFSMELGDELLLTTDGVFEQLYDHGGAEAILSGSSPGAPLFDALCGGLEQSLVGGSQKDDITMVHLRHRRQTDLGVQTIPFRRSANSNGEGDVPV